MIALCLQCCPLDQVEAIQLTELICDIEPAKRGDGEFFLVYRKDCPLSLAKTFVKLASQKFERVEAREARNFDVGWPAGSNMLAGSAFIEMTILQRQGTCKHEAFLLFEPDCVPMLPDWLDLLSAEWETTKALGKEAFGHWHQQGDVDTLHMNGNAVFRTDYFERHSTMIIGAGTQGWDYFFREKIIQISRDSNLIFQNYNRHGLTREEWDAIEKNGEKPALFHGCKTPHGRMLAREILVTDKVVTSTAPG